MVRISYSLLLAVVVLSFVDLSVESPRGRGGRSRYGSSSGGWSGRGRGGHRRKSSNKIVCRATYLNGTQFYNAACPNPLTACRSVPELDTIKGRIWNDGNPIVLNKYLCEQLPCQVVNTQFPQLADPAQECPTGTTCQPLPQDYQGRQKLIYQSVNEPGYEGRYCQPQICKVVQSGGVTLEGSESVCPESYTCDQMRWNWWRGQIYYRINPITGATEVIPGVSISKCKTTSTVDPNAAYKEIVENLGQSAWNWWNLFNQGTIGGTVPEIIPVPVPFNPEAPEPVSPQIEPTDPNNLPILTKLEELEEMYPIDPR